MRNITLLSSALALLVICCSCQQTRYITEAYIKNNIQEHAPDTKSEVKTYSIYQGFSREDKNAAKYIEFTGCKYNDTKKLVVGADNHYLAKNLQVVTAPDFVVLNMTQTLAILSNYNELKELIQQQRPIPSEEIYEDYAVNPDFYISFRKAIGRQGTKTIDVWIKGNKFPIKTKKFVKKLKSFVNY